MSWQPQPDGLSSLLQLLKDGMAPDKLTQQVVHERMESFQSVPDYNCYLVYILTQLPDAESQTRSVAGLILKNNIVYRFNNIPAEVLQYVKDSLLRSVGDPDPHVRGTVGIVITTIVSKARIQSWPQVLTVLMEALDNSDVNVVEGAFGALQKICEDSARDLDQDIEGVRPLNFMIPKFISFFDSPHTKIRVSALVCVNQFIIMRSQSLMVNIDAFVNALFTRATDNQPEVRKNVCQALVMLLEVRPDKLLPHIENVVEYMLFSTKDEDDQVALEACEFWLTFAEQEELRSHLHPFLPRIIPVLLEGMVYSEMDIMALGGDEDDTNVPDSDQDIKPRFHRSKPVTLEPGDPAVNGQESAAKSYGEGGEEDEDDEDDEDIDDDEIYSEWNLRKCSAAALDVLATVFNNDLLEILLPYLKNNLFSDDWKVRECGILALGAVAEGCVSGVEPHLRDLIPFLLQQLTYPKPLVRSITCWTLGRYSRWCVEQSVTPDGRQKYFEPLMEGLLRMVLDNNKRVQEAGCSAFATLEEEAMEELVPYLLPILTSLCSAFRKYQHKNLLILYDAIGTLADSVGLALNDQKCIDVLMPPLISKWEELEDENTDLFPLLECLSSVTQALGQGFKPFAEPVFVRCVKLVHTALMKYNMHLNDPMLDAPDKDFMIVALDLLSGLVQGLGPSVESLVSSSQISLLELLAHCLIDPIPEVRQSAYALLGDLSIACFTHVKPYLARFMTNLIGQIDPQAEHVSVCNNAAWAAGEIALQWGAEITSYVPPLLERLIALLRNEGTPRTLSENAAITIGRLGLVVPTVVAPRLEEFLEPWCKSLRGIRDNEEKESAFRGLCEMIQVNPNGAVRGFVFFCDAVSQWQNPSPQLNNNFRSILHGYKQMYGAQWEPTVSQMPPVIRQVLLERYGV